jgi:hypothetical protein
MEILKPAQRIWNCSAPDMMHLYAVPVGIITKLPPAIYWQGQNFKRFQKLFIHSMPGCLDQ